MKPLTNISIVLVVLCTSMSAMGQKERLTLRQGNSSYEDGDFQSAIGKYEEALDIDKNYGKAYYNKGNAHYRANEIDAAVQEYELAASNAKDPIEESQVFHNLGNCYLNTARALMNQAPNPNDSVQPPDPQQFVRASIETYKKALRKNPTDEETRYNLAYAQQLLEEGGGGGQDQEQDQKQDEEQQDEQEQDESGEDEQEQQEQQNGDEEQEQQGEQPQPDQGEMSKEQAEQMLKALDQQEKDLQDQLGKERIQGERIKIEKDW